MAHLAGQSFSLFLQIAPATTHRFLAAGYMSKSKIIFAVVGFAAILVFIANVTKPADRPFAGRMDRIAVISTWAPLAKRPHYSMGIDERQRLYTLSRDCWVGRYELCVTFGDDGMAKKVWRRWRWR